MRPRKSTIILQPPRVRGFIPIGYYANEQEPINLFLEEYEAIRLLDHMDLSQEETAEFMGVSRPTLTRIYKRARKKIAQALANSQQILIEGGTAIYDKQWFYCKNCQVLFDNPNKTANKYCPICSEQTIEIIEQ